MMSAEAVLQYPSQAARNFELLAGFMKSAADFADEAGRKLLKVFKAVVITGDETGECRKEDMIDLARHEAFLELVKRPETVDEEMYRSVFYEKLKRDVDQSGYAGRHSAVSGVDRTGAESY